MASSSRTIAADTLNILLKTFDSFSDNLMALISNTWSHFLGHPAYTERETQRNKRDRQTVSLPFHSTLQLLCFLLVNFRRWRKDPRLQNIDPQQERCITRRLYKCNHILAQTQIRKYSGATDPHQGWNTC